MPDRRRSWKTDSQWLRLSLAAGGVGVSLVLAYVAGWNERWVLYIGGGLALVAVYIALAVLFMPLPLPALLSERRNWEFRRGVATLLAEAHQLRDRPVTDDSELVALRSDYERWDAQAQAWLGEHSRSRDAVAFAHVVGPEQHIAGSYDDIHNDLRLRLSWQIQVLRDMPVEA